MLKNWFRGGVAGKKIVWVGDSTTYQMAPVANGGAAGLNDYYLQKYVNEPGSVLHGVSNVWMGSNGNSLANFIANFPATDGLSAAIANAGDLYVISYGINDARLGNTSNLVANLKYAIDQIKAALPSAEILLRMPSSFLTTDVNGNGYVVPNSSAQTYSTALQQAYYACDGYNGAVLYASQETLFPKVCQAAFLYMQDQLHPTVAGYKKIFDQIVAIIGLVEPFNVGLADNSQFLDYFNAPVLYYPRVVEGGDYDKISEGDFVVSQTGYIDYAAPTSDSSIICQGDIVVQNGNAAFMLPASASFVPIGANLRLNNLGSLPVYNQAGGRVSVWRQRYLGNLANKPYVNNPAYNKQQLFKVTAAQLGFIRIAAMPNDAPAYNLVNGAQLGWDHKPNDVLLGPWGPIALTNATWVPLGNQWQISITGVDFSMNSTQVKLVSTKF